MPEYVDMDEIYRRVPHEAIPWNVEEPPAPLVELIDSGRVLPCRAIDFGCGTGNIALYLAGRGFDVTGVDISPTALGAARAKASKRGVTCAFVAADVLDDLSEIEATFDFALDWELLHHIFPEDRPAYVDNVFRKLNPGGLYLSTCFSEEDPQFGGQGKYRTTPLGTHLYFSSESEMRDLFERRFEVEELRTIQVRGRTAAHAAILALLRKR